MLGCVFPDSITPLTIKILVNKINNLVNLEKDMNFQLAGKNL